MVSRVRFEKDFFSFRVCITGRVQVSGSGHSAILVSLEFTASTTAGLTGSFLTTFCSGNGALVPSYSSDLGAL
jgi:hypothetical protein